MRPSLLIPTLIPLLAACATGPGETLPVPATLNQIGDRPVVIIHDRGRHNGILNAIHEYESLLTHITAADPRHHEAQGRIADLYLRMAGTASLEDDQQETATAYFLAAARSYRSLTTLHQGHGDTLWYALARAYSGAGNGPGMVAALKSLVDHYPDSPLAPEAYFRLGEYAFSGEDYASAALAYENAQGHGKGSPFQRQAIYKQAWSRYKGRQFKLALQTFAHVIEIRLKAKANTGQTQIENLPKTERNLIDDSLRGIALCLAHLGGLQDIGLALTAIPKTQAYWVYQSLADYFLEKGADQKAIATLRSYTRTAPYTRAAARFWLQIDTIQTRQQQTQAAWDTRAQFARNFGINSPFWKQHDIQINPWLTDRLRQVLNRLSRHAHALAQRSGNPMDYRQAAQWYEAYIALFPGDAQTPDMRYLLAELLYSSGQYLQASQHYESFAYQFPGHSQAAEAAYAAIEARTHIANATHEDLEGFVRRARRFATHFPNHPNTGPVLVRAAQRLWDTSQTRRALSLIETLQDSHPVPPAKIRRTAWTLKGQIHFEQGQYPASERAFAQALSLASNDPAAATTLRDQLAASIYKQGEKARAAGTPSVAIAHFLRIHELAAGSQIEPNAEYDAATLQLQQHSWVSAITSLDRFMKHYPGNKNIPAAREKLAIALLNAGKKKRAAHVFSRIAVDTTLDTPVRREALMQSASLFDTSQDYDAAMMRYRQYLERYPIPLAMAQEIRQRLADLYTLRQQPHMQRHWLNEMIRADRQDSSGGTHRLAALASLKIASLLEADFRKIRLTLPLKTSMTRKKAAMEAVLAAYGQAADFGLAETTTAATYHLGETFHELSRALLSSEHPKGLSADDLDDYQALLEEQAYPVEEQAIQIHEGNIRRMNQGLYDYWIRASLEQLELLFPARYRRKEHYEAFIETP